MDVQNISVAVRARPLFSQEESTSSPWSITNNSLLLRASNSIYKDNVFRYQTVFGPADDNATVYSQTAAPLVNTVLSGINCTLLAYGQTGSGKTHTILGSSNDPGVVPRAWSELFHEISCNKTRVFTVHATFLELYNEELRDLMDPTGDKLQVQQVRDGTCIIPGLRRFEVRSYEQIQDLLQQASNNRVLSATKMNQMSSRSHALFSLIIESEALSHNDPHPHLYSTLVVVDLAGSERTAKSGTETGIRRREREAINLSLLSLGMVISQLTEGGTAGRHVNYRNSLLTRLLQVSLGGNARTCMICTITPSSAQLDESISTLRFASNATKVKNRLRVNVESSDAVKIAHLKQEVEQLKKQGIELQRRLSGTESDWGSRGAADASWEAERSALVTDLEACRSLVRELQMENVNLQRQIKDKQKMEEELLTTQQMVKELKKQNAVLTANLAFEREMQQQLQLLLTRSQASLEDPPQYSELMQEISVLTMELQIITAQRDIKEGKCGTLAFKLVALQDKLASSQAKRNQLMVEVTELKEKLESTQTRLQAYIHDAADRLPDNDITIISEKDRKLLSTSSLSDKIMSWDADLVADLTQMVYNREVKLRTSEAQTEEDWEEVAKVAHNLAADLDPEQQPSTSGSTSAAAAAAAAAAAGKYVNTAVQASGSTAGPAGSTIIPAASTNTAAGTALARAPDTTTRAATSIVPAAGTTTTAATTIAFAAGPATPAAATVAPAAGTAMPAATTVAPAAGTTTPATTAIAPATATTDPVSSPVPIANSPSAPAAVTTPATHFVAPVTNMVPPAIPSDKSASPLGSAELADSPSMPSAAACFAPVFAVPITPSRTAGTAHAVPTPAGGSRTASPAQDASNFTPSTTPATPAPSHSTAAVTVTHSRSSPTSSPSSSSSTKPDAPARTSSNASGPDHPESLSPIPNAPAGSVSVAAGTDDSEPSAADPSRERASPIAVPEPTEATEPQPVKGSTLKKVSPRRGVMKQGADGPATNMKPAGPEPVSAFRKVSKAAKLEASAGTTVPAVHLFPTREGVQQGVQPPAPAAPADHHVLTDDVQEQETPLVPDASAPVIKAAAGFGPAESAMQSAAPVGVQSAAQSAAQSAVLPAAQPAAQSAVLPTAQSDAESATLPGARFGVQPGAQSASQPAAQLVAEPVAQSAARSAAQSADVADKPSASSAAKPQSRPGTGSGKTKAGQVKGKVKAAAVLAAKKIGKAARGEPGMDSDGVDSDGGDGTRGSESSDIPDTDLEVDLYNRQLGLAGRSSSEDEDVWVAGGGRTAPMMPLVARGRVPAPVATSNVVLATEQLQRALEETEAQLRQMARLRGAKILAKQQAAPSASSPMSLNETLQRQSSPSRPPSATLPPIPTAPRPFAAPPSPGTSKQEEVIVAPASPSLPPRPVPATPRGLGPSGGMAQMGTASSEGVMPAQAAPAPVEVVAAGSTHDESGDSTPTSSSSCSEEDSPLSLRDGQQAALTALVKAALSPAAKPASPAPARYAQEEVPAFNAGTAQPQSPQHIPASPLVPDSPQTQLEKLVGRGADADVEDELASPSPSLARMSVPAPRAEPLSPSMDDRVMISDPDFSPSAGHNDSAASEVYSPDSQADPDLQVIILPEIQAITASAQKSPVSKALSFAVVPSASKHDDDGLAMDTNPFSRSSGGAAVTVGVVDVVLPCAAVAGVQDGKKKKFEGIDVATPGGGEMLTGVEGDGEEKVVREEVGQEGVEGVVGAVDVVGDVEFVRESKKLPRSPRTPTASLLMDSNFEQLYGGGFKSDADESESVEQAPAQETGRSSEGEVDYIVPVEEEEVGVEVDKQEGDVDVSEEVVEEGEGVSAVRVRALFTGASEDNFPQLSSSPVMKPSTALSFFRASYMPPTPSHATLPTTPSASAQLPSAVSATHPALSPISAVTLGEGEEGVPQTHPAPSLPARQAQLPDGHPPRDDVQQADLYTGFFEGKVRVSEEVVHKTAAHLVPGQARHAQAASAAAPADSAPAGGHAPHGAEHPIPTLLASNKLESVKSISTSSSSVSSLGSGAESTESSPMNEGPKVSKPATVAAGGPYLDAASRFSGAADPAPTHLPADTDLPDSPASIGSSINIPTATTFFRPAVAAQPNNVPPAATSAAAPTAPLSLPTTPTFGPVLAPAFGPSAIITPGPVFAPAVVTPCSHPGTPKSAASLVKSSTTPMHTPRSVMHTPTSSPRNNVPRSQDFSWKEPEVDSPNSVAVPSATAFYRPHFAPTTPPRVPGQTGSTALQAFSPSNARAAVGTLLFGSSGSSEAGGPATHLRTNSATDFFRPQLAAHVRSNSLELDSEGHVSGGSSPSSVIIPRATAFYRPHFVPSVPVPPQATLPSYSPSQSYPPPGTQGTTLPTYAIVPSPSPAVLKPSSSFEPASMSFGPDSPVAPRQTVANVSGVNAPLKPEPMAGLIPPGPWSYSTVPEREPAAEPLKAVSAVPQFQLSPHVVHYPPPETPLPLSQPDFPLDTAPTLAQDITTISPPLSPTSLPDETPMEPVYTPDSETLSGRLLSPPSIITRPISPFHIDLIMDGPGDMLIDNQFVVERSTSSDPVMSVNDMFPKNFARWSNLKSTSSTGSSLPEDAPLPSSTVWLQPGDMNNLELASIQQIQELQVWSTTHEAELAAEKVQIESFGQGFKDMIEELSKEVLIQSEGVLMQSPLNTAEIEL